MRRKLLAIASLFVFPLSACGSPSDEDILTDAKIQASQSAPELPDVQLSENPEPPPAPPPLPEEPPGNELENAIENDVIPAGVPGTIPPAFQALWGVVPSDCRPGDVTGNAIMITGDQILAADSVGSLQGVLGDYPGRFEGRFAFDDATEGREQLALSGNRNVLIRTSGGQQVTYRRCGAGRPTG